MIIKNIWHQQLNRGIEMYKLVDKKDIDFLIDTCGEENVLVGSDINEDFFT